MASSALTMRPLVRAKAFLSSLGPGLITGAADDDPSGIATFSVAGAAFGYSLLWTAVITVPMMIAVQLMCARLGMVSGRGLAGSLRAQFPRAVLWGACALLVTANVFNLGADLGGMAEVTNMVTRIPAPFWTVFYTALILLWLMFSKYRTIARYLKWTTMVLFSYVFAAFFAHPAWRQVLRGTVAPEWHLSREYIATLVGILGTSISPYLFFWQSSQEVEEQRALGHTTLASRQGASNEELAESRNDVVTGMGFSNLIVYFIMVTTAATLHAHHKSGIETARQAAEALRPLAGSGAYLLFALGLIGVGLLAVPVLAGASAYAVAESAGWRASLEEGIWRGRKFYCVLGAALAIGLGINFLRLNAIKMLFWAAVLNGILAPPLIVLLILLTRRPKVMGEHTSPRWLSWLGWATAGIMSAAVVAMFMTS